MVAVAPPRGVTCPARGWRGRRAWAGGGAVGRRSGVACHALSGPEPCPTTVVPIVAIPLRALTAAARNTSAADRGKPWPAAAVGAPPRGGPEPCAPTVVPIVAIPLRALTAAARNTSAADRVKPWP